ncbi:hypothetical protein B0H63DRAFT_390105 [Podospora didyma]|uniref:Zn(2)-C6 fungal-type domain-containing protein n=1 Tax=Podospora didyma TaxID=330526 RepID=A0AAE0NXX5_9PEZI|nr:hypothetical protein B0H63DRAFT_390105 [Podospora didyma]
MGQPIATYVKSDLDSRAGLPAASGGRGQGDGTDDGDGDDNGESRPAPPANPAANKSRRVRTGCLTCRERHLKCDEGLPDCNNCRKSSRECKRGVRLNFIDVQVKNPPYMPPRKDWSVQFQDESRLIASEYQGGLGRYAQLDQNTITPPRETDPDAGFRRPLGLGADEVTPFSEGARDNGASSTRGGYYSSHVGHTGSPSQEADYDDVRLPHIRELQSRHNVDAFAAASSSLPASHAASTSGHFSIHGPYAVKEESVTRSYAQKPSDTPSISSSLVAEGTESTVQTRRPSAQDSSQLHDTTEGLITPPSERSSVGREYLTSEDEMHFMRVFIDEVAIWMDSMDKDKHFTNMTPHLALKSPMLLNAFLACGVKHLTLVEAHSDEKALFYYDTATTQLLRCLQNPDRNIDECATTAVVLNVYEIMSEKPTQRMSHIAGARALIKECGWNAAAVGIGAACFWINIGMEVLSCLAFNWQTTWDPDQWGLNLDFASWTTENDSKENDSGPRCEDGFGGGRDGDNNNGLGGDGAGRGQEELWVHRIFYIVAKIANFRASIPRFQEASPHDEQVRMQSRFAEWKRLKGMCDAWNNNCPRPMRPYGYSYMPSNKSQFPNVWLINRPAIVGRLFYHTAMCLLAQINPLNPRDSEENRAAQLHHAHQVCGIVAHTKDRGAASVAIRSLAIASAVLTDKDEQDEVLQILDRINRDTGWRLGKVLMELKKIWGWEIGVPLGLAPMGVGPCTPGPQPQSRRSSRGGNPTPGPPPQFFSSSQPPPQHQQTTAPSPTTTVATPMPMRPNVNPLLAHADFTHQNHPYQNWYEPPNRLNVPNSQSVWSS